MNLPVSQVQVELRHAPWPVHDGSPEHTCDEVSCKISRMKDEYIVSAGDEDPWLSVSLCSDSL